MVPSQWYEGQPRVILEAFAAGVPVLASRIGGLPELVEDDFNGYLVTPRDEDGWRAAMENVAATQSNRDVSGTARTRPGRLDSRQL